MRNDFLDDDEITALGIAAVGRDVRISRHAIFFAPDRTILGDHSRIDAFCIISAGVDGVRIGRNVHISAYTAILGRAKVEIGDFATISARCTIFSSSDDYSGLTMGNATVPERYRGTTDAPVIVQPHAIVGAGSILLPGITIGESACVGAASLVKVNVMPLDVVAGVPARVIGRRRQEHRGLTERLLQEEERSGAIETDG
jgi:acetyltransferase-like isoleucine patch superfamily enzyme